MWWLGHWRLHSYNTATQSRLFVPQGRAIVDQLETEFLLETKQVISEALWSICGTNECMAAYWGCTDNRPIIGIGRLSAVLPIIGIGRLLAGIGRLLFPMYYDSIGYWNYIFLIWTDNKFSFYSYTNSANVLVALFSYALVCCIIQ